MLKKSAHNSTVLLPWLQDLSVREQVVRSTFLLIWVAGSRKNVINCSNFAKTLCRKTVLLMRTQEIHKRFGFHTCFGSDYLQDKQWGPPGSFCPWSLETLDSPLLWLTSILKVYKLALPVISCYITMVYLTVLYWSMRYICLWSAWNYPVHQWLQKHVMQGDLLSLLCLLCVWMYGNVSGCGMLAH